MTTTDIHGCYVALLHRPKTGPYVRHVELVGLWLRRNAECLLRGKPDDWIAVAIAPTPQQASELLDRMQEDLQR